MMKYMLKREAGRMEKIGIFPNLKEFEKEVSEQNLQIQTYGRRIRNSQTFYEYLIEFLLVFMGEKDGERGFKKIKDYNSKVKYKNNSNIALKRFIFLDSSKKDNIYDIDVDANLMLNESLLEKINAEGISAKECLEIIRELFIGFTAYSGDRGWFAKALLPLCEETIFPEAIGRMKDRKEAKKSGSGFIEYGKITLKVDKKFEFKAHNFLARGGEVYFLHILQGFLEIENLNGKESSENIKNEMETRLFELINTLPEFKRLSKWIQNTWINILKKETGKEEEEIKEALREDLECQWISEYYKQRAPYTVKELLNILRADINEFEKFEVMSLGIIYQILRMMSEVATHIATENLKKPIWIIDVDNMSQNRKLKKIATDSYKKIEEHMIIAVSKMVRGEESKLLKNAYDDSHKLLRKLGKEIGFVVPIKGDNMRFSINDGIIKFLVLAVVEPQKKMTLDTFLRNLNTQFGIVIGPREYEEYLYERGIESDTSCFNYNLEAFQNLLRKNGFLKELSDATSIVINPYKNLEV